MTSRHNGAVLQECVPYERSRMLLMLMGSFSPRALPHTRAAHKGARRSPAPSLQLNKCHRWHKTRL